LTNYTIVSVLVVFTVLFFAFLVMPEAIACTCFFCMRACSPDAPVGGAALKPEDYSRAMKLCKFATSALQYEDSKTAIENLTKALNLLTSGHE